MTKPKLPMTKPNHFHFRAWDLAEKKMHHMGIDGVSDSSFWRWFSRYAAELMQSTGLLDKNGKEIFFGDVCRVDWNDKRYPPHCIEIEWNDEKCSIDIEGGSPKSDCANHYEVIGNIYENPELLK